MKWLLSNREWIICVIAIGVLFFVGWLLNKETFRKSASNRKKSTFKRRSNKLR
jgi:predicted negative regulator of RcsB-dependent stress response